MEQIVTRPLTPEEQRLLAKHAPSFLLSLWPPIASGGCFLLLFSLPVLWASKYVAFVKTWQPLFFAIFAVWLVPQMLSMFNAERKRSQSLRRDLEAGRAQIRRYEVVDAIRVEETEDEGTGFFLKLTDGRTLFLCGQQFYELEEDKQFPCSSFEIVETPDAKWPLGLECTGQYFAPSYVRGPFDEQEVMAGRAPCDGDVLEVDFESLKSRNQSIQPAC